MTGMTENDRKRESARSREQHDRERTEASGIQTEEEDRKGKRA